MAKNIIRSARNNRPFTSINNAMLNDRRLSLAARGLLALLISKPPGWEVNVSWVMDEGGVGKEKAYNLLKELIDSGYCQRRQLRAGNRQGTVEYILSDMPFELPEKPEAETELPGSQLPAFQLPEKPDAYKGKKVRKERQIENPLTPKGEPESDAVQIVNSDGKLAFSRKYWESWLELCGGDEKWLLLAVAEIETRLHESRNSNLPLESRVARQLTSALRYKHERDQRYKAAVNRNASKRDDDDPFAGRRDH